MLREVRDELATTPKKYKVADEIKHRARSHVNRLVRETVAMFAWGVSEEIVPVEVWQALKTTPHLRAGESAARETKHREPVSPKDFEGILPLLPPVMADLVRFCRITSCRPVEACNLRMRDVEPCAGVLKWTLAKHKTAHHGVIKAIPIGPRAEEIVRRWAAGKSPDEPVFSRADRDRVKVEGTITTHTLRAARQTFTPQEIRNAIQAACELAERPKWTTYQLRHAGLSEVRQELGVEAEAAVAGWTTPKLAYHYARLKFDEAAEAAKRLG
jgi:integrase